VRVRNREIPSVTNLDRERDMNREREMTVIDSNLLSCYFKVLFMGFIVFFLMKHYQGKGNAIISSYLDLDM